MNKFYKNSVARFKFEKFKNSDVRKSGTKKFVSVLSAIIISFLLSMVLACSVCKAWPDAGKIFGAIFLAPFNGMTNINLLLCNVSIFIIASLAFIVSFKTGLFNIGISGQMLAGATMATIVGQCCNLPSGASQFVMFLASVLTASLLGWLVAFLKTRLNVNEVVSSIMLNWIIYFLIILLLSTVVKNVSSSGDYTNDLPHSFRMVFHGSKYGYPWAIIFAAICMFVCFFILKYTTLGWKFKATGLSKTGAQAVGYNTNKRITQSLIISGFLAGVLGIVVYCCFSLQMPITASAKSIPQEGFNGIAVGLIFMCSPLASAPISFFFSMIQVSVSEMQIYGVDVNIPQVIFGIVVYGAAVVSLLLNFKPYWLSISMFKGKNYMKLKKELNISKAELINLADHYSNELVEYYQVSQKVLNKSNTLKFSKFEKFIIWNAYIKNRILYFWLSKIRKQPSEKIRANVKIVLTQNVANGQSTRQKYIMNNRIIDIRFRQLKQNFSQIGVNSLWTKDRLKFAQQIFYTCYINAKQEIEQHYQKYLDLLKEDRNQKINFDSITYDEQKILQIYHNNLNSVLKTSLAFNAKAIKVKNYNQEENLENLFIKEQVQQQNVVKTIGGK